jgi:predicted O-methyltransferase YrrM
MAKVKQSGAHRPALLELVKSRMYTRGAELGVDKGILFEMLLKGKPNLQLLGVDIWEAHPHRYEKCMGIAQKYGGRAWLMRKRTVEAAEAFEDGYFDFVFIDADHSHQAVKEDIAAWRPKVRPGGWLGGHDYHPKKFPGVVSAVKEVFGKSVHFRDGWIWGVNV